MVRSIFIRNFESAAICVLSLVLFLIPSFFETTLNIQIPTLFENIIYLFIFAAEILGEISHYYVLIPGWDTALHTLNGFLCAAIGFSLVDVMNRKSAQMDLSPLYVAIVAFCFSMTVGVIWEFIECFADRVFMMDMQKDFVVTAFGSVSLDPNNSGSVVRLYNIIETQITTASGEVYIIENGYLDIGILDTMKDLFVNFIGAIVFSILGYAYITNRDKPRKYKIAEKLMISKNRDDEDSQDHEDTTAHD